MKKNIALAIVIVLIIALILCGCSGKNANTTDTTDTTNIVDSNTNPNPSTETLVEISEEKAEVEVDEVNMEMFTEVEPTSGNLNFYRSDIVRRKNMETFLPEKEKEVLKEAGYVVFDDHLVSQSGSDLYYPVVYRYQKGLFLWTTSSYGSISIKMVHGSCSSFFSNYGGELHFFKNLDGCSEEVIRETSQFSLSYDPVKGEVKRWEFGKVVGQYAVPQESVYCGFAFFDGFIFRQGTDVFALNWVNASDMEDDAMETVPIAHGVKFVLMTEYRQNSDAWSSPLFIMEDGEIKAYVGWDSYGETPDDPGHLVPPEYEGGYH